ASATDMVTELKDQRFDVVFFNLSLHHFIGKSYADTRRNQRNALAQAVSLLAPGGRLVVTENLYDGLVIDNLPGWIVYTLTASGFLAPVIKRLGANTAGCGVCYHSAGAWRNEFARLGFHDSAFSANVWKERRLWRAMCFWLMTIRSISTGFFWLQQQPVQN
ncbi:MAG TPA: class I SAM-dependent methyltransferase, partial [Candidatus Cybelea sp.]|nr:class I SAM-dependent methyltransferase [Candidatus Cybelea sp.]